MDKPPIYFLAPCYNEATYFQEDQVDKVLLIDETIDWSPYFKKPELVRNKPIWWHPGGINIEIESLSDNSVHLKSRFVRLSFIKEYASQGVIIEWHIHSLLDSHALEKHHYQGKMSFDMPTAAAAFGMVDLCHRSSAWMIDFYGAQAARQGFFIRYGDYLSIPGPGTGRDGDSNLSLFLEPDIKEWFLKLLPQSTESRQISLLKK